MSHGHDIFSESPEIENRIFTYMPHRRLTFAEFNDESE